MLLMGQQLLSRPVVSLRTGGRLGTIEDVIINPNNLKIEGWFVEDTINKRRSILLSQDVRDIINQGFVVNDFDDLSDPSELVRLQKTLELKFKLIGKSVVTEGKQRLGKVGDYAFEKNAFFIQKLYIEQSIIKSFSGGGAIVDRDQIITINNRQIVVADATIPAKVEKRVTQPAMNPVQP